MDQQILLEEPQIVLVTQVTQTGQNCGPDDDDQDCLPDSGGDCMPDWSG